ncbi:MAG TPA: hypothetical protein VMT68_11950 [Caulobacteraceae bacterium]|nr:hypothetical protein [Caulobacteraceae bacterium]
MKRTLVAALVLALASAPLASPAFSAAQCKDAHGKFIKCPAPTPPKPPTPTPKPPVATTPPATTVAGRCTDPKTHRFIKCPPPPAQTGGTLKGHCRDPKTGRFVKCGTPGSVPA